MFIDVPEREIKKKNQRIPAKLLGVGGGERSLVL